MENSLYRMGEAAPAAAPAIIQITLAIPSFTTWKSTCPPSAVTPRDSAHRPRVGGECSYRVRNSRRRVCSTSCRMFCSVKTLPRVASNSLRMSSRRTPKPRPAMQATTSNAG